MDLSPKYPPWVRENQHQQGLVTESAKYSQLLTRNMVRLCATVILRGLWRHLISLGVLDFSLRSRLVTLGTNGEQVEGLLEYLLKSPCWKLHAFVRSLCMNDQDHVVSQILGLDTKDYLDAKQDQDPTTCSIEHREEMKSERDLTEGKHKLTYSMERCIIEVVATSDELLKDPDKILAADILEAKADKPRVRTVLLLGHPGVGKSTVINCHVETWCQTGDGQSNWDLIVMLNVSTLKLTVGNSVKEEIKEAIKQSLEGGTVKEAIMRSLDDDNLDILVIPEGMNECRSETVLEMLKELISRCYRGKLGFTVLSTCRSGLSWIEEGWFENSMEINGFTREEGIQYVSRYYDEIRKPDDDSVYNFIASSEGELDHILTNPLSTHVLSVVTAHGALTLSKGQKLSQKTLFEALERFMTEEQVEKHEAHEENLLEREELDDQKHRFYNLSLYTLLKDEKIITQNHFDTFQISDNNPYLTFLTKRHGLNEEMEITGNNPEIKAVWTYSHDRFHAYFSARALEALPDDLCTAILLKISSDQKFRNTQRIIFRALGRDVVHSRKLSEMICVNTIAQGYLENLDCKYYRLLDLYNIKEKVKAGIDLDVLLSTLLPGEKDRIHVETSKATELHERIQQLYQRESELLQTSEFLFQLELIENKSLIQHIYNCLNEVPEEHRQQVFENSLGRTLPSTKSSSSYRNILYNTGGMRWSEVSGNINMLTVHINHSLTDAAEAVRQYGEQHLLTLLRDNDTKQLGNITLNMECPAIFKHNNIMWGEFMHDQFLCTALWSTLLSDIHDWPVNAKRLTVFFNHNERRNGVKGFLQCLQMERTRDALKRLMVQDKGGWLMIEVLFGEIDSESLLVWTDWYLQQELLQVRMWQLRCQISGEDSATREQQQKRVHELQKVVHNGWRLFKDSQIIEEDRIVSYENDKIEVLPPPRKRQRVAGDRLGQHQDQS